MRNKPHIVWDVRLLRKVFDIEADVDHLSFIFIRAVEGNQEAASQFVDDASVKLQHAFNFLVAVESLGSRRLLGVPILISLYYLFFLFTLLPFLPFPLRFRCFDFIEEA